MSDQGPFISSADAQERLLDANYEDGISEISEDHADPVTVSISVFDQDGDVPNSANLSTLFTTFGQFLDHELVLSPESHDGDPLDLAGMPHDVPRSTIADGTGGDTPIAPENAVTWQIDGSQIYGSTTGREAELRSFEDGKLLTTQDESSANTLLPHADPTTIMAGDITSDDPVYLAGDIRANENPNLLSMHTMFVREHNLWAEKLAATHPDWDDQQIFDGARQIVEYELQQITYTEWLPHLVGDAVAEEYEHDPDVSGQISVEFSTAAFRFGHTMVSSSVDQMGDDGTEAGSGGLLENFFNHHMVEDGGIDALIRGQLANTAQELDTQIVDDLNFFLSTPAGVSGFSLAAINIARGLDHGLPSYITARAELLGDIDPDTIDPNDFSIITDDIDLQARLADAFDDVFQVDLWTGGLSEAHIDGTQLGPLFTYIVSDQFTRTRAADETFGQLDPDLGADIIAAVQDSSFADIITRTTDVDMVQEDVFVASDRALTDSEMPETTWGDDALDLEALALHGDLNSANGNDDITLSGGTHLEGDIKTGQGADTVSMSSGWVTGDISTDGGADTVALSGTAKVGDDIRTGGGSDTVTLADMAQVADDIKTAEGDDTVSLEGRASVGGAIKTGGGDDTISLGGRVSVAEGLRAGGGDDTITVTNGADLPLIHGGRGTDTLDIDGAHRIEWNEDGTSGDIVWLDEDGAETGRIAFKSIEAVTCFTPGTRLITQRGMVAIETLQIGDHVWTLDDGLQPVRWIGRVTVPATENLAPIRIAKGALGNSRDLLVSPQHRMLLDDWRVELHCAEDEVLAPARGLTNDSTIRPQPGGLVTYIHIAFDRHQIVMAEGIPSESFYPGATALTALDQAARDELLALFPEWHDTTTGIPTARHTLSVREARILSN